MVNPVVVACKEFFCRDDVSRMTTGKKNTITSWYRIDTKANFSSLKISVLLGEYAAEKDWLQSNFSNDFTNKRKHAELEVVQNSINGCMVAYRKVDELKEKWGGLKRG